MNPPNAPSAIDRLREVFRAPPSFGAASGPSAAQHDAHPADDAWDDGAAGNVWPDRPRRFRLDPGLPGTRVLALAGLLAAILGGVYLWSSRPRAHPATQAVVRPLARPAAMPSATTPVPSPALVMVDVAGKVRHPGVVALTAGARVIDAIKKAGGIRPGAKTENLNLARHVVDGEQILVGVTATPPPNPPGAGAAGTTAPGTPVDLNTATATQLDQLPGVGPVLAQRIVDYRTQHGGFHSVDELRQVSGIGDAKFADLKPLVRA